MRLPRVVVFDHDNMMRGTIPPQPFDFVGCDGFESRGGIARDGGT